MSMTMDEEIKRWTARRKSALVLEIIQGKTTVAEASRQFDLPPSEIEEPPSRLESSSTTANSNAASVRGLSGTFGDAALLNQQSGT